MQTKCDTLVKEREAVQTIMEQKIKVIVQNVAQAASTLISTNPQLSGTPTEAALNKELTALQRLVNASIVALKNAAAAGSNSSTASTPTSSSNSYSAPGQANNRAAKSANGTANSQMHQNQNISQNNQPNAPTSQQQRLAPPPPQMGSQKPNFGVQSAATLPQASLRNSADYTSAIRNSSSLSSSTMGAGTGASGSYSNGSGSSNGNESAQSNGWGNKDEYYSSGDVFRRS